MRSTLGKCRQRRVLISLLTRSRLKFDSRTIRLGGTKQIWPTSGRTLHVNAPPLTLPSHAARSEDQACHWPFHAQIRRWLSTLIRLMPTSHLHWAAHPARGPRAAREAAHACPAHPQAADVTCGIRHP